MKKKQKILIFSLATAVVLTLAGCSGGSSGGSSIWGIIAIPLGYIMNYCYIFVHDILHMPLAYVFAMFLFALITKLLLFPLSIKQQRSTAKMAAFKPMMDEINKKYAKDKQRQNQELQKLQEELGYNPMSGCLPMLIQFPILFGLVEVIYRPLSFMLMFPKELVTKLTEVTTKIIEAAGGAVNARLIETNIIEQVKTNTGSFSALFSDAAYSEYMNKILNLDMSIGSINLWEIPTFKNADGKFVLSLILLLPLFSVITMVISSLVSMKMSGSGEASGAASGKTMMIMMAVMFGFFSFTFPAGFSLYWGLQNLIIILQSWVLKKICDPEKMKAEAIAEIEEKKKARKAKKTVKIKTEEGEVVEADINPSELAKLRLQKARELDAERYKDE